MSVKLEFFYHFTNEDFELFCFNWKFSATKQLRTLARKYAKITVLLAYSSSTWTEGNPVLARQFFYENLKNLQNQIFWPKWANNHLTLLFSCYDAVDDENLLETLFTFENKFLLKFVKSKSESARKIEKGDFYCTQNADWRFHRWQNSGDASGKKGLFAFSNLGDPNKKVRIGDIKQL